MFGADVPISSLPAASSVTGSDVVPIVQSGTTKKSTFTVQKGLWDTFYQPKDADLTAIAALSGTHNIYYRSAANTWSSVTVGNGLNFTGATLAVNTPTPTPTPTPTATPEGVRRGWSHRVAQARTGGPRHRPGDVRDGRG